MDFHDALPRLITAYRRGELVPFLGAGMSRKACTDWEQFVRLLEAQADISILEPGETTSSSLEFTRRADRAVQRLQNRGQKHLLDACRSALVSSEAGNVKPPQTAALAKVEWPLVLTTNYDDWFVSCADDERARIEQKRALENASRWLQTKSTTTRILGRGIGDCHEVLASLDVNSAPILWALQGFLGGQSGAYNVSLLGSKREELASQLVVGHQHYQRVINSELHFRRAFAEVFRRRSMWFLGSGLQEDYFVNLFSEIIVNYGSGSLPHFAFMTADKSQQHADFLLNRLNVTPIVYSSRDELPDLLSEFAEAVASRRVFAFPGGRVEERFSLREHPLAQLVITEGTLPLPGPGEWTAFSAGRSSRLHLGSMGRRLLNEACAAGNLPSASDAIDRGTTPDPWKPLDSEGFVYQLEDHPFVAVAARHKGGMRDLRSIAPSVTTLLNVAAAAGVSHIHLGLLSAGPGRDWHPIFSLIEMAKGARQFARQPASSSAPMTLQIHAIDSSALLPLLQGKLHIDELVGCDDIRFWAVVARQDGQRERVLLVRSEDDEIQSVAELLGVPKAGWLVQTIPGPSRSSKAEPLTEVATKQLEEFGVIHSSTLVFSPESRDEPASKA